MTFWDGIEAQMRAELFGPARESQGEHLTRAAAADLEHLAGQPGAGEQVQRSLRYAARVLRYLAEHGTIRLELGGWICYQRSDEEVK